MDSSTTPQPGATLVGAIARQSVKIEAASDLTVTSLVDAVRNDVLLDAIAGDLTLSATVDAAEDISLLAESGHRLFSGSDL